jgi:hypothetical protein
MAVFIMYVLLYDVMCCGDGVCTLVQDPLADGPTIQAAHTRGLENGTTLDKVRGGVPCAHPAGTFDKLGTDSLCMGQ